jgi:peptidoglycan/xylan/chitin deacetylase (PgdA/CDA1 family)
MARLTLSFDNGPTTETTPHVLDVLGERNMRATFFVVGNRLSEPGAVALAQRAQQEGHWVGNHSTTHETPLGLCAGPDHAEREIGETQTRLADAGLVHRDRLFRPFGRGGRLGRHLLSTDAVDHQMAHRYTMVLWDSVPRDWEDPDGWPERARRDLEARDHTVLVLHDLPTGAMSRLGEFLDAVTEAGTEVVQEFPDHCVPLRRGEVCGPIHHLVTVADAHDAVVGQGGGRDDPARPTGRRRG